ncbi:MOSC domain-containing protein [Tessaracoccus lubricantis]
MEILARIAAVRVGRVQTHLWEGREVSSGAVKHAIDGPVHLGPLGFDGDEQADTAVHGGPEKAALLYAAHHYPRWHAERSLAMPDGGFFENLTLADVDGAGPDETTVVLGETWRIGGAVVQVSQPRSPCWKLAKRWGIPSLVLDVQETGWSGWYVRVLEPGAVAAGDAVELLERPDEPTVAEVARVMNRDKRDLDGARRLLASQQLPQRWRQKLEKRLAGAVEDDSARLNGTSG